MQERYSEEVKSILEAAQQQAVMNYQQELSCAHILVALSSSEGFFRFLLANVKADERNFAQEAKALMQRIPSVKGQDRQLVMSTALARVLGLAAQAAGAPWAAVSSRTSSTTFISGVTSRSTLQLIPSRETMESCPLVSTAGFRISTRIPRSL